jgi:hypothetical protein
MTVTAEEFLRRFMLHVLPRRFVSIRFSGFLANRRRKQLLHLCQRLLDDNPQQRAWTGCNEAKPRAVWLCPHCGGAMVLIEKLTARSAGDLSTGRISLTVRSRYPVAELQRASARALHVCLVSYGRPKFEERDVPSNFATLRIRPFRSQDGQLRSGSIRKSPILEASKSIQYP